MKQKKRIKEGLVPAESASNSTSQSTIINETTMPDGSSENSRESN